MKYFVIDLETTEYNGQKEIIEISIIAVEDERIVNTYTTFINPEVPLSPRIIELTGISPRMLHDAPKIYDVADLIMEKLHQQMIVGHDVTQDFTLIQRDLERYGHQIKSKLICTKELSQRYFPNLAGHSLQNLCQYFKISLKQHHRAECDARATLDLYKIFSMKFLHYYQKPKRNETTVPTCIDAPEVPGLLYLNNTTRTSYNLKQDVLFLLKKDRSLSITFTPTYSPLISLLHIEQKHKFQILSMRDEKQIILFKISPFNQKNHKSKPLLTFTSYKEAKNFLIEIERDLPLPTLQGLNELDREHAVQEYNKKIQARMNRLKLNRTYFVSTYNAKEDKQAFIYFKQNILRVGVCTKQDLALARQGQIGNALPITRERISILKQSLMKLPKGHELYF
jgi:DNA polymerase III epsilon subunit family exonuclease